MSGNLSRRLAAVEAQHQKAWPPQRVYRFQPDDLDEAEMAAWYDAEIKSAEAAGLAVTIYRWREPGCVDTDEGSHHA